MTQDEKTVISNVVHGDLENALYFHGPEGQNPQVVESKIKRAIAALERLIGPQEPKRGKAQS